jgi:hypothetical protein
MECIAVESAMAFGQAGARAKAERFQRRKKAM